MTISTSSLEGQTLMQLSHKIVLNSQDKNGKTALFFSLVFDFKEKKKMMWQHRVSAHHTVHFLTFKIESRGAIVDEAPKAKVDSFSCFLMIRIFFSLQSTSLSILEQELVHSAAFFPLFYPDIFSSRNHIWSGSKVVRAYNRILIIFHHDIIVSNPHPFSTSTISIYKKWKKRLAINIFDLSLTLQPV